MDVQPTYYEIVPLTYTGTAERFTYHSDSILTLGQIVKIPLGPRKINGVVLSSVPKPEFKTRAITASLETVPVPGYLLTLATWISEYYATSLSSVFGTLLPSGVNKTRRPRKIKDVIASGLPTAPLTEEQASALKSVQDSAFQTHLLHGVTGAGKTRIYLELAQQSLNRNRSVIILVPEITLTPQLIKQFESAFGSVVIATHSKLTEAERHIAWTLASEAFQNNQPKIIIGPRSSLFLPAYNLGLIVVDECHETSYKQEQHPRYHAVTVAGKLGQITKSILILGSATPGLNELYLAREKRINYIRLTKRANNISHTEAVILDLRNKDLFKASKFITQPLIEEIEKNIAGKRQSLLYLNRRGSASSQVCGNCGHVTSCPNCSLPLTFHADLMRLICHHCNFRIVAAAICSECGAADLKLLGGGTKRIEAEVIRMWPEARVARLDRDSATLSHIKSMYSDLLSGNIDILIGTQMIAKGLDLPSIDTVGIISADTMLHLPDFTAAERTYQLISQVSGRAGRGDRPGKIIIQTYSPTHPAIVAAATNDYDGFALSELQERALLQYPPSTFLLKLELSASTRELAETESKGFATTLRELQGIAVAGPAPAFIETRGGRFVWILSVKATERKKLVSIAKNLPNERWVADLDPINLL